MAGRAAYFPKGGAEKTSKFTKPELPARPTEYGPVFDTEHSQLPIAGYDKDLYDQVYGGRSETGEAVVPDAPPGFDQSYLHPMLSENERLRLTLLWYHTRLIEEDDVLLAKIDTLVKGLQQAIGWDYAIAGILNESTYTRLATSHLPIARLPRREATCAHTINQELSSVFMVADMSQDWRFKQSPHVECGGLRSYAGTQLRLLADHGEEIALGSLCVASDTPQPPLSQFQQDLIVRFAELISSSITTHTRQRRLKEREHMESLLSTLENDVGLDYETNAVNVVRQMYPDAQVSLQVSRDGMLAVNGRPAFSFSEVYQSLWEDTQFIEEIIRTSNYAVLKAAQTVRAVVARCGSSDKYIVVASSNIQHVFDDFDAWYVSKSASIIGDTLQGLLLQQALEVRENFLRGMTHTLRTPLHGILGSVELLAEELASRAALDAGIDSRPDSTSPSACIATIKNSGQELMTTVNNILKHNTWTDALRPCQLEPYNLKRLERDILPEVLALLPSERLRGVSIDFRHEFMDDRCIFNTDAQMLKDCLQAIILNAIQAVLLNVVGVVSVTARTTSDISWLIIDIVDNGSGIELANHHRVFEPYEKLDSLKPGAGLGLTLSSKIATTLGGSVKLVSSALASGSHFRVEFSNPDMSALTESSASAMPTLDNLPRRFSDVSSGDTRNHFMDHVTGYLSKNGFERSAIADAGLIITDKNSKEFIAEIRNSNPNAPVVNCQPGHNVNPSEELPSLITMTGPVHTQRLDEILHRADQLYQNLSREMAKKKLKEIGTVYSHCESVAEAPPPSPDVLTMARLSLDSDTAPSTPRNTTSPLKALLVDDNLINLRVLQMFCHKRQIPYITAEDGDKAYQQYKRAVEASEPFTLVLMDLQMPHCDGIQATAAIRAYEAQRGLEGCSIFMVTGQDSAKDKAGSRGAGADEFLVKPVGPRELDKHISHYFKHYKAARQ
ncbi:hypothetical protein TruAng_000455 [Truncatella angustata]|nr:hypothetical protein TruAng_000455 [Truncatella angustata]